MWELAAQQGHQLTFHQTVGDVYKVLTFLWKKTSFKL